MVSEDDVQEIWDVTQQNVDAAADRAAEGSWPTMEQAESYVYAD